MIALRIVTRCLRCEHPLERHLSTLLTVRCKSSDYVFRKSVPTLFTSIFHNQVGVNYFSHRVPKIESVSDIDAEKYSDSDSDSEEEALLDTIVKNGKPLSSAEWEKVKSDICSKDRRVSSYTVDALLMARCSTHRQLEVGISLLNHLSESGKELNVATIANFLRLCFYCKNNDVDQELILSLYQKICSRCPVLDAYTSESCILALSLTEKWKDGLELIDMIKLTCSPGSLEYCCLVKSAFDRNEPDTGMKLIEDLLQHRRIPRPELYHSWLDYIDRASEGNNITRWKKVEELLQLLVDNDLQPTVDVAERLKEWYKATGSKRNGEFTNITDKGLCCSCNKFLNPIKITQEEFENLQSSFLSRVMVGKDIFSKTNPEELEKFKNFVKETSPFDIVLDGLNIAYAKGVTRGGPQLYADNLQRVVKFFVRKSPKILVLGRKHMLTWPKNTMEYVYKNSHVFLAENLSHDDPFLLYAALYSGLGTKFVSRDLMRGHSFLLENKTLRSTFKRWQSQHQCQLLHITQMGKIRLKFPLRFSPMAQKNVDGSWHIPYVMEYKASPPQEFEPPPLWVCLNPKILRRSVDSVLKP